MKPLTPTEQCADRLLKKCWRYEKALQRIAGEDYRGNRPHSATIAWRALHPEETAP